MNMTFSSITAAPNPGRRRWAIRKPNWCAPGGGCYLGEEPQAAGARRGGNQLRVPDNGHELAAETRAVFEAVLDPARHRCSSIISRRSAGMCIMRSARPGCSSRTGLKNGAGAARMPNSTRASNAVWNEVGWAGLPRGVTGLAGNMIHEIRQPGTAGGGAAAHSPAARSPPASAIPNPPAAPTCSPPKPAPCAMAMTGSSTARRCSPRVPNGPATCCC